MCETKQSKALVRISISIIKTLIYKTRILIYIFKPALVSNNIISSLILCF